MEEKTPLSETEFRQMCDDAFEHSQDERDLGREILARVWQRLGERDPYGPVPSEDTGQLWTVYLEIDAELILILIIYF